MTLADKFSGLATKMLANYGEQVVYKQVNSGSYDSATGTIANTETTINVSAFVVQSSDDYKVQENSTEQIGTQNINTKVTMYISAVELGVVPAPNDLITYKSADWQVKKFDYMSANGQNVMYKIALEK